MTVRKRGKRNRENRRPPFDTSGSSRTPRHFYGSRRDVQRRCLNSPRLPASSFNCADPAETLPYQPNESLLEDPSRLQEDVPGVEDNEEFNENGQLYSSCLSFSRSPLTSTTVHNVRPAPPPMHQSGVIAMLQQQQALLQKVLQQQEEMKAQQSVLSKKLEDEIHSSSCSSSPVSRKGKNRVTRDLTY